jgi:type IV secretory pathway TrbD component
MTTRQIQLLLASVFLSLGAWCLLAPASVMALTIRPEYQSHDRIAMILMGAFGAQAMIAGLFAAFSRFVKATFLAYGIGLLPFFVFDYWFFVVEPVFTPLGMLDAVGNVLMLSLCWQGWRTARA